MFSKVEIYKIDQQYSLQKVSEVLFQNVMVNQTVILPNNKLFSICDDQICLYTHDNQKLSTIQYHPQATCICLWNNKIVIGDQQGRIGVYSYDDDQLKLIIQQQIYPFEVGFRDFDIIDNRLCCSSYSGICSIIDIQIENEKITFNRVLDWQADYTCISQSKMLTKDLIITCGSSKNVKLWQLNNFENLGIQAIKLDQLTTEEFNLVMAINREQNLLQVSSDKQIKIIQLHDSKFQVIRQIFPSNKAICGLLWLQ